jgi:hypothetical protein
MRHMSPEEGRAVMESIQAAGTVLKTVEQGAATSVWCATSPMLDGMGGVYCEDADIAEITPPDSDRGTGVRPWAIDPDFAERLWAMTAAWTGVAPGAP